MKTWRHCCVVSPVSFLVINSHERPTSLEQICLEGNQPRVSCILSISKKTHESVFFAKAVTFCWLFLVFLSKERVEIVCFSIVVSPRLKMSVLTVLTLRIYVIEDVP